MCILRSPNLPIPTPNTRIHPIQTADSRQQAAGGGGREEDGAAPFTNNPFNDAPFYAKRQQQLPQQQQPTAINAPQLSRAAQQPSSPAGSRQQQPR